MASFSKNFKITLTILSLFTIAITAFMDLNQSHMTNPLWAPHARFHWAIQYFSTVVISLFVLLGLWAPYKDKGTTLSILILGLGLLNFWGMFIPALMMPGTSTAPDGIQLPTNYPPIFKIVHPNFIISCVITLLCIGITWNELKLKKRATINKTEY